MTVATILPFVPAQWFTSAGDAVLAGGMLEFYEVGTTTPKEVYADYQATTPIAQPVVLNAAGKANVFLGAGGYKVILKDAFGAVMDTVDGIFGDPSTANGGSLQTGLGTFADLRAFANPGVVASVLVAGAIEQGDGGGGIFTFDPTISEADDGGIIIAPSAGSGRWLRAISGIPCLSWWGIKGLTTESDDIAIGRAFSYCNANNTSLLVDKHDAGMRTNKTFSGSRLIFSGGDFYTADAALTLTISGGATVEADLHDKIINGTGVIRYGAGQVISPEWTSAVIDETGIAIAVAAAGASNTTMLVSSLYVCSGSISIPANINLDFTQDGAFAFASAANLFVGRLLYSGLDQKFSWNAVTDVGTVHVGENPVRPELFGADGSVSSDASIPLKAALSHGSVVGASSATYKSVSAQSCAGVRFLSAEQFGSTTRPLFLFDGGLGASGPIYCSNTAIEMGTGTIAAISGDYASIDFDGTIINGAITVTNSTLSASGQCFSSILANSTAESSTLTAIEGLPAMAWTLTDCTVSGTSEMYLYWATGCKISTPIRFIAPTLGGTPQLRESTVSHAKYLPTFSADSTVYPNVSGCTFTSSAPVPAYAWANANNWRFPMSSDTVRATYTGCTQNGVKVWDPHAVSIDGVDVEWVGSPALVPMPYAQWGGLPAGAGASGDNIAFSLGAYTSLPLNDGSTFASTYELGNGSFCNEFGYAMVTFNLTSSDATAFVDVVCATAPLWEPTVPAGFPDWPSPSQIVRSVSVKTAVRITPGNTVTIPVWIGVENSVLAKKSNTIFRDSTHKLQVQIIGYNVPTGSLVTAKVAEAVVTRPEVFEALYAAPNLAIDPQTAPMWAPNWYTIPQTYKRRAVDSYSFREVTSEKDGERRLIVTGNDLIEDSRITVNDQTTYGSQQWRIENVGGITYYRSFGFQVVAPRPIGPVYYPNLIAANLRGSVISYTKERSGLTQPTATTQTHIGLEI